MSIHGCYSTVSSSQKVNASWPPCHLLDLPSCVPEERMIYVKQRAYDCMISDYSVQSIVWKQGGRLLFMKTWNLPFDRLRCDLEDITTSQYSDVLMHHAPWKCDGRWPCSFHRLLLVKAPQLENGLTGGSKFSSVIKQVVGVSRFQLSNNLSIAVNKDA